MSETVLVAVLAMIGTIIGSVLGILAANKLTVYRIGELEKKVDKHNTIIERTYKIENDIAILKKDINELKGENHNES